MDPATYDFIGTLVGAIVGASASVAKTLIGSWNSTRLQMPFSLIVRSMTK